MILLLAGLLAAQDPSWPAANGPTGNYLPAASGHRLVEKMEDARLLWMSETTDLGYGKTATGELGMINKMPGHPGSASTPIVAAGKVFVSTWRPSGSVAARFTGPFVVEMNKRNKPIPPDQFDRLRFNTRIEAEDLVVAIDAATGKTAWKEVEPGGLNYNVGKRDIWGCSPAYLDGRIFALGTTGMLRAYDAESGKKLWEVATPMRDELLKMREKLLADPGRMAKRHAEADIAVVGGVVILPLHDGKMGIRGIDPKTGATLWTVPCALNRWGMPSTWRHDGREYLVCTNARGELTLIDPASGRILWKVEGLGPMLDTPAVSGDVVVVNTATYGDDVPKEDRWAVMGGYRLSLEGAKRVWTLPKDPAHGFYAKPDDGPRRHVAAASGGRFLYRAIGKSKSRDGRMYLIDGETGRILAETPLYVEGDHGATAPQLYQVEDRVLVALDGSHRESVTLRLHTLSDLAPNGPDWGLKHTTITAYETYIEIPYVDGRIFMRSWDGRVACYDLRAR